MILNFQAHQLIIRKNSPTPPLPSREFTNINDFLTTIETTTRFSIFYTHEAVKIRITVQKWSITPRSKNVWREKKQIYAYMKFSSLLHLSILVFPQVICLVRRAIPNSRQAWETICSTQILDYFLIPIWWKYRYHRIMDLKKGTRVKVLKIFL